MESTPTLNRIASDDDGSFLAELHACIEECVRCAQICTSCVDATMVDTEIGRLSPHVISAALTCADVCWATVRVLSRPTALDAAKHASA